MKNKNYIHHMSYLRNSVAYNHGFWGTFVKLCYLQVFFSFFQKLIFQVVRGVKGQKKVQNDKEFCLSRSISQEPYSIWLSFMVHLCNMIISLDVFFFFFFFILFFFWFFFWGKRAKNGPKWQKICLLCSISQEPNTYDCHLWCTCVKW